MHYLSGKRARGIRWVSPFWIVGCLLLPPPAAQMGGRGNFGKPRHGQSDERDGDVAIAANTAGKFG